MRQDAKESLWVLITMGWDGAGGDTGGANHLVYADFKRQWESVHVLASECLHHY